jgi:CRISPR system Cascade subunit CasD
LQRPRFVLYLGRKCCPPALPLAPQIIEAADLRKAFDKAEFADAHLLARLPRIGERIFVWEDGIDSGMEAMHVTPRRDEPTSRKRWQFGERDEYYRSEQRDAVTGRKL